MALVNNHYECGMAKRGLYSIVTPEIAEEEWSLDELETDAAYLLGLFNENGDGTVLFGAAEDILNFVDGLHRYAHRELGARLCPGAAPVVATNRGAGGDTWAAWRFYRRVRSRFADWNHVVLGYRDNQRGVEAGPLVSKVVCFVDDCGNALELCGVNFGYDGGTPRELSRVLREEGFPAAAVAAGVLNEGGDQVYPQTIARDL